MTTQGTKNSKNNLNTRAKNQKAHKGCISQIPIRVGLSVWGRLFSGALIESDWDADSTYRAGTILYQWQQHLELSRHVSQSKRENGPRSSGSILLGCSGSNWGFCFR